MRQPTTDSMGSVQRQWELCWRNLQASGLGSLKGMHGQVPDCHTLLIPKCCLEISGKLRRRAQLSSCTGSDYLHGLRQADIEVLLAAAIAVHACMLGCQYSPGAAASDL